MESNLVKIVIPARMGSSRFPGKPLCQIDGLPMIEHVRRRCQLVEGAGGVYVATCDTEIKEVVEKFGGQVVMTSDTHLRPSERIQEAANIIGAESVLMVQGDEPLVHPKTLSKVINDFMSSVESGIQVTNLVHPIKDISETMDPNVVKVVLSVNGNILFFSRSLVPSGFNSEDFQYYKQSGIICFTTKVLEQYVNIGSSLLETQESIDMLRLVENEIKIKAYVEQNETKAVDHQEHVSIIEYELKKDDEQRLINEQIKQGVTN